MQRQIGMLIFLFLILYLTCSASGGGVCPARPGRGEALGRTGRVGQSHSLPAATRDTVVHASLPNAACVWLRHLTAQLAPVYAIWLTVK